LFFNGLWAACAGNVIRIDDADVMAPGPRLPVLDAGRQRKAAKLLQK
jgi:hypothetical protein